MEHKKVAPAKRVRGILALEDGHCFPGISVGVEDISSGEVVFNTSLTGYQEIISDMSHAGQIVAMAAPQVGNVGVNPEDDESVKPLLKGLLMREFSSRVSNWRATERLDDYLLRHKIVALSEIDTRSLTRHLCEHGLKRGIIAAGDWDAGELIRRAKEVPRLEEIDFVDRLTVSKILPLPGLAVGYAHATQPSVVGLKCSDPVPGQSVGYAHAKQYPICSKTIAVYDFGVRRSVLRSLASLGAKVILVPARTSAADVLKLQPDGVVLSNGPGDPARLKSIAAEIAKLVGRVPLLGIGLGHQLLGMALGASTNRLPFGHFGTQPVRDTRTGKIAITFQDHSFCVDSKTLPSEVEVSHVNVQDGTVEGLRHKDLPILSVQFRPESGPHESADLYEQFLRL